MRNKRGKRDFSGFKDINPDLEDGHVCGTLVGMLLKWEGFVCVIHDRTRTE